VVKQQMAQRQVEMVRKLVVWNWVMRVQGVMPAVVPAILELVQEKAVELPQAAQ